MTVLPPPPPVWRRLLALPRQLARQVRWRARMRRRAWAWRLRRGLWPSLGGSLRRAWVATDPNGALRAFEEIRRLIAPAPPPARPSAGAEARFTGPLSVRSWRGDARLGDDDLADWLIRELGGDPGTEGIPVELVVRVLADDAGRMGRDDT